MVTISDEKNINVFVENKDTLETNLSDINYFPSYAEEEKKRQQNEIEREKYINQLQQDVENGKFDGAIHYTAGEGIEITEDNVINIKDVIGSSIWGEIQGDIDNQNDLIEKLNDKANLSDIPKNVSELINDSQYVEQKIMAEEMKNKANMSDIPTNVSELINDSQYITKNETYTKEEIKQLTLPTKKISGTSLTISDGKKIKELKIYGKSEQDGTPTPDAPVEINSIGIENLFDKDNANILNAFFETSVSTITSNSNNRMLYIPCKPNTTYTFSKAKSNQFWVGYTDELPVAGVTVNGMIRGTIATDFYPNERVSVTITTGENAKYLVLRYYHAINDGEYSTEEEMRSTIQIEKGSVVNKYVPYGKYLRIDNIGQNKFNKDDVILGKIWNGQSNSARAYGYIKAEEGQEYTISCDNIDSFSNIAIVETSTINTSSTPIKQTNNSTAFSITFIPNEKTKYIVIQFALSSGTITKKMIDNVNIQIKKGSESTEYESYRNDVTYVNLAKEDLFDGELELGSLSNSNGNTETNNNTIRSKNFNPVNPNETYTIKNNKEYAQYIYEYDEDYNFIKFTNNQRTPFTFITGDTTKYIKFRTVAGNVENDLTTQFKLYKGSSAKDYYDLCSIEDTRDELEVISGKGTKYINEVVLDGSDDEKWEYYNNYDSGIYRFRTRVLNSKANTKALSNLLKQISYDTTKEGIFVHTSNDKDINIFILGSRLADISTTELALSSFKTWLSENNLHLKYVLLEPEEFTLEPTKIPMVEGKENNYYVDDPLEPNIECIYDTIFKGDDGGANNLSYDTETNLLQLMQDETPVGDPVEIVSGSSVNVVTDINATGESDVPNANTIKKYVDDNVPIDFIVERKQSGNWNYTKYNSGIIDMYYKSDFSIPLEGVYSNEYWTKVSNLGFPIELKSIIGATIDVISKGNLVKSNFEEITNTNCTCFLYCNLQETRSGTVLIQIKGTYK